LAAARGLQEMAIILLRKGANINAPDRYGLTPLHMAVQYNHPNMVSLLAGWGADLEARSYDRGLTPLHWAAFTGNPHTVKTLMRCGADLTATDNNGHTPYDWAGRYRNTSSARMLARRGGHWGAN
jgi:ankyrin repeat protein